MNSLSVLSEEYISSLRILNYSKITTNELERKLNKFFGFLEKLDISRADQITQEHIREWQAELYHAVNFKGKPNGIPHQNKMLAAVKQFLAFLNDRDYIVADPAKDIKYAKEPQTLPKSILTKAEIKKIIHTPDVRCAIGYRDRTILEVLYSTGIRSQELCNLILEDVDYHDGFVRIIQGKGKKDRVVPIGRIACRYLENYIKGVRQEFVKDPHNNSLFFTSRGNPMNSDALWKLVKKYGRKAKIKKNIYPHTFRHTCATGMLKNNANIRAIQELLGHAFLDATQIYTHVNITDLKKVHSKCHPRERDPV
jgi:integrase/recombinase XerD